MFDRFSDNAKLSMRHAREAAIARRHEFISTEHMLLGLLDSPDCEALMVLNRIGIQLEQVRSRIEDQMMVAPKLRKQTKVSGVLPFTSQGKRVLEQAMRAASLTKQDSINTVALLLGLIYEGEGVAAAVLSDLGVSPDVILDKAKAKAVMVLEPTPSRLGCMGLLVLGTAAAWFA